MNCLRRKRNQKEVCNQKEYKYEVDINMKRFVVILSAMLLLLVLLTGCESKEAKQQEYIGIISAMDNEVDMLLSEAEIDHVDTIGDIDYHVGTLRDRPVIIAKAGIGKIRSSSGITAMLDKYPVSNVIFTGIAGGIADETQVLDEVISTRLIEHDYGKLTDKKLLYATGDPANATGECAYFDADPKLVDLAYDAATEVVGEEHCFKGVIATGDQFIASEEQVKRLREDFNAYACEMEGAAIAIVCTKYEVPFVVIRALSDKADGKAHESYTDMGTKAADNSSRIVLRMLETIGE